MENEKKSVSHKELRESFYRLRDFEISNLWQRSIFLSALLVLFFSAYGFLVSKLLEEGSTNTILYNEISAVLALFAISFSIIWIMMAKGSKVWYEVYERKICKIEQESDLQIAKEYQMGADIKPWDLDASIWTNKAGSYSVSKLNIVIGRFLLYIWLSIFVFHWLFILYILLNQGINEGGVHWVVLTALFFIMLFILNSAMKNRWAPSGCLN
jgi:hypothetical protein